MISLAKDEKIVKTFEVIASNHGRGTLYLTSLGIAFESKKYGPVLDVSFEWLRSYSAPKKDRFVLVWDTPRNHRFTYSFKIESARQVEKTYALTNQQYADSEPAAIHV